VDFFARQEQTRRTSRVLVGAFLVAFLVCALATTVVASIALRTYMENSALYLGTENWQDWLAAHLLLVAAIGGGTFAVMGFASLFRAASLAGGGGQVARMLGATPVTGEGSDQLERRLVNVVEEIALASGVPVPEIYVLEQEAGINAFAAGLNHSNAAITVTRGALERLDRAELQGVIAHEFSHILNGDMRLNQQLIGLSFGILVLSLMGRWMLRSMRFRTRGKGNGGAAALLAIGIALVLIGAIGVFCSRLIKAAVSRQRESLADASAVQFTRDTQGLAGALKKIAGVGARITTVETEEVAHMMFERPAASFSGWFATHPPLLERIRALDPAFDPRDLPEPGAAPAAASTRDEQVVGGVSALAGGSAPSSEALLDRAGESESPEVGGALRSSLPEEVYHAARSRDGSLLLVLALALAPHEPSRQRQLALIESQLGGVRAGQCRRLNEDMQRVDVRLRLPVLELALPALKRRPAEQVRYLLDLLKRVNDLDAEHSLFDFVLLRVLAAYLRAQPSAAQAGAKTAEGTKPARREAVRNLLANVAACGNADAATARAAYEAGAAAVGWRDDNPPSFDPPSSVRDLEKLDAALLELAALRPNDKQKLLRSVLAAIRSDRKVEVEEAELFRAIAATLDCPLPPNFSI
jgi:Zn-dependent protease with chaperone function